MRTAPGQLRLYQDVGLRIPYATRLVLDVGSAMVDYSWAVALIGVLFVAVDVFVFVLLASHRRTHILGWAWAAAVTVGLLAIPGPMLVAVVAPEFKLRGLIR